MWPNGGQTWTEVFVNIRLDSAPGTSASASRSSKVFVKKDGPWQMTADRLALWREDLDALSGDLFATMLSEAARDLNPQPFPNSSWRPTAIFDLPLGAEYECTASKRPLHRGTHL
jgi:hypothetical protein